MSLAPAEGSEEERQASPSDDATSSFNEQMEFLTMLNSSYTREEVEKILQSCNHDVDLAANILLRDKQVEEGQAGGVADLPPPKCRGTSSSISRKRPAKERKGFIGGGGPMARGIPIEEKHLLNTTNWTARSRCTHLTHPFKKKNT